MDYFFTMLFMIASYLRPGDLSAELAALRIPFWLGNLGMVTGGVRVLFQGRTTVWKSPQLILLLAFSTALVLSPLFAKHWLGGSIAAFSLFSTTLISYFIIILTVDTAAKVRYLAALIGVLSVVLVCQGALAVHFDLGRDLFILSQNTSTDDAQIRTMDRVRGLGYLNDPNDLAQALVAAAPLLWPFWRAGRRFLNFACVILPSLILLYGVYLTHSRGGAVSAVIVAAMLTREKMPRFRTTGAIAIALLLLAVISLSGLSGGRGVSGDESSAGRLDSWGAGFQMLRSSPLFGVGFGAFTDFSILTAHNSFILCMAELGLAGYFLWIGLLTVAIWELLKVEELTSGDEDFEELGGWCKAARFSLYAYLSGAFFLSRTYSPTLYVSLAIAFVVIDIARRSGYEGIPLGTMVSRIVGLGSFGLIFLYGVTRTGNLWVR